MKIRIPYLLTITVTLDLTEPRNGYVRICGRGFWWKDLRRHRLSFSERNGYTPYRTIGNWAWGWLR